LRKNLKSIRIQYDCLLKNNQKKRGTVMKKKIDPRLCEAASLYLARKYRNCGAWPKGKYDKAGRWHSAPEERNVKQSEPLKVARLIESARHKTSP
jgi:hypothetical protein